MTATGDDELVVFPLPSEPRSFIPQQYAEPDPDRAHPNRNPTPIPFKTRLPARFPGVERSTVVPSPSAPDTFSPQHTPLPALSMPQLL